MKRTRHTPKVSIGIPVYNGDRWIRKTIESILSQTFDNFELVISDNASTDGTVEICREFSALDCRVRLHQNETNVGAAINFNTAFHLARAEYFKWASSNDLLAPTMLERCVEVLDSHPEAVIAAPKTQIIDENDRVTERCREDMHLYQDDPYERFTAFLNRVQLNNLEQALVRSSVLAKTSLQVPYPGNDTILVAELVARGKVFEISEYLLSKRLAKTSSTKGMAQDKKAAFYLPRKTHIPHIALKRFVSFLSIAKRLEEPLSVRYKFYVYAVRYLGWSRQQIGQDFAEQFRRLVGLSRT